MSVLPPRAPAVRPEDVHYRPSKRGEDEAIVAALNAAYRTPWGTVEKWRFKHGGRPGFDPETIFLAEHNGGIVGCLHTTVRPIRFGGGIVRQSFDGDLAVNPRLKGAMVPERLYEFSNEAHHRKRVELRGGYTQQALWERFYRPRIGYVSGFDGTRAFKKLLVAKPMKARLDRLFDAKPDDRSVTSGPIVEFRIEGVEPFRYRLLSDGVRSLDVPAPGSLLVIDIRQRFFDHRGTGIGARLKMLLTGAVRVSGAVSAIPALVTAVLRARKRRSGTPAS